MILGTHSFKCDHPFKVDNWQKIGFTPAGLQRVGCKICRSQRAKDRFTASGEAKTDKVKNRAPMRVHPDCKPRRF